jgi:hypothetical protein
MKRIALLAPFAALAFVAMVGLSARLPARADTIVNTYFALPGHVSDCAWFVDNLNDRSLDAMIRQTDMLYNRAAPQPDENVNVVETGATAAGQQLIAFDMGRRLMCTSADVLHPVPEASPAP